MKKLEDPRSAAPDFHFVFILSEKSFSNLTLIDELICFHFRNTFRFTCELLF